MGSTLMTLELRYNSTASLALASSKIVPLYVVSRTSSVVTDLPKVANPKSRIHHFPGVTKAMYLTLEHTEASGIDH